MTDRSEGAEEEGKGVTRLDGVHVGVVFGTHAYGHLEGGGEYNLHQFLLLLLSLLLVMLMFLLFLLPLLLLLQPPPAQAGVWASPQSADSLGQEKHSPSGFCSQTQRSGSRQAPGQTSSAIVSSCHLS